LTSRISDDQIEILTEKLSTQIDGNPDVFFGLLRRLSVSQFNKYLYLIPQLLIGGKLNTTSSVSNLLSQLSLRQTEDVFLL